MVNRAVTTIDEGKQHQREKSGNNCNSTCYKATCNDEIEEQILPNEKEK